MCMKGTSEQRRHLLRRCSKVPLQQRAAPGCGEMAKTPNNGGGGIYTELGVCHVITG
jgi:hypothetical protein